MHRNLCRRARLSIPEMIIISRSTYDLVDAGDLGLENSDGISDRRLLVGVGNSRGAESASLQGGELLILAHSRDNFRKHPLIIINLLTMLDPI